MFHHLTQWLAEIAHQMPLGAFVVIFEFLAPIPSQSILLIAGTLALLQGKTWSFIILLAVIGAAAKTVGDGVFYGLAYKAEQVFVSRWGKFFGVTEKSIESIHKRFHRGNKDIIAMILIRAIPIMPGIPLSIASGVIKMDAKVFLLGTFIGLIPHNLIILSIAYTGSTAFGRITEHLDSIGSIIQLLLFIGLVLGLGWLYWKQHKKN